MFLREQTHINTKLDLKSSQNLSVIAGVLNNDERVYKHFHVWKSGRKDDFYYKRMCTPRKR